METNLAAIVDRFPGVRMTVLGDVMLDCYMEGVTRRLCPEAPVPVLDVASEVELPGGAANTAGNLAKLGANVRLISAVGTDCEGERLTALLSKYSNVEARLISVRGRKTLCKRRIAADGHLIVRLDQGSTESLSSPEESLLIEEIADAIHDTQMIVISDYQYGVLTPSVIQFLKHLSQTTRIPIVVDAKDLARFRELSPVAVKPNFGQVQQLLGETVGDVQRARVHFLQNQGQELLTRTGASIVAATLDRDGALIFAQGRTPHRTFARSSPSTNTAGAGDSFLAAFSLSLAVGADPETAGDIASAAAGIVVSQKHTAVCSRESLLNALTDVGSSHYSLNSLMPSLIEHRDRGHRIVLTNGCFDILHRGHITYLQQARGLGDVLIVGVNSDDSIRRLKGDERPINQLEDRLKVLAAISCIDHLVVFEEETPHALIQAIRPDVFVKGGDYSRETLPEAPLVEQLGGAVKILPLLDGRSTTRLITRIREDHREGFERAAIQGALLQ